MNLEKRAPATQQLHRLIAGRMTIERGACDVVIEIDRAAILQKFRSALEKSGDRAAGEKIFTERCATCHRYAGKGVAVGPDLESVRGNGREYLLTHILDPNREVNTRFFMYVAELRDGDAISGILARETDSEVTLRLANAEEKTIPRSQLKSLKASAQSLMPVGLAWLQNAVFGLPYIAPSPASHEGATSGPHGFPFWIRWSHGTNGSGTAPCASATPSCALSSSTVP